ncbi:Hypothetical protein R9X50_00414500 [Acrodontium crateriforme]|uniref:Major facilitator superfamily (MFS) profile domain-containing protein n=1 Tax=Acrodontium crateriforme TaxID=150365 RepID=A0AAQ3R9Z3_9PEZI|nr:Hypothetical protein R9X50_00414500 [Acrodontium crateriforme]
MVTSSELTELKAVPGSNELSAPVLVSPRPSTSKPDGGSLAWLQVFCSSLLFFNTFGLANTFGIYQKYYESGQLFVASSSQISWIGSLQAFLILLVGTLTGPAFDGGHLRILLIAGMFGVGFGHMMLSICYDYWQVLLAQGVVVGLGAGCLHVPSLAILPGYFSKRLGLAVGIAVFGSSVGGVISPIAFEKMIHEVGFGWSVRVLGFIAIALLLVPILCMRMRETPTQKRALFDYSVCRDNSFIIFVVACVVGYCGLYVPVFYLAFFGQSSGMLTSRMASYLVPIFNASSVPGRLIPGYFADKTAPLNLMAPCSVILGILVASLIAVNHSVALLVVTVLTGVFSGVYLSLPSVVVAQITKDKSRIGTRIGILFASVGLGVLAGGPGAGAILGRQPSHREWMGTWTYSCVCIFTSGILLAVLNFRLRAKAPKLVT